MHVYAGKTLHASLMHIFQNDHFITILILFKGKYRHVPVHLIFCVGTLLHYQLLHSHIGPLLNSALYTKQTLRENSDVSSLFTDSPLRSSSFEEDNKKMF